MPKEKVETLEDKQKFEFFDFAKGTVEIYADWAASEKPLLLGYLKAYKTSNSCSHSVTLAPEGIDLLNNTRANLDPEIKAIAGEQFSLKPFFNCMEDSSPDRWGKTLMRRFYERRQKNQAEAESAIGAARKSKRGAVAVHLNAVQYMLGVHDQFRMGALRYKIQGKPEFLDHHNDQKWAIPAMMNLQELANAAARIEDETLDITDEEYEYLRMLLAPGGSLGGARPKASVVNTNGQLCIAKFPSNKDEVDKAAWESVAAALAKGCDITTPNNKIMKLNHKHHTFVSERFDRIGVDQRIHFASAMCLSGLTDGQASHDNGISYSRVLEILRTGGSQTRVDARELWTRIVFSILIKNTDDHMRNHGFILVPGKGWRLSPAYDINPEPKGSGLSLNISEHDNALDLDLALSVCGNYFWKLADAKDKISEMKGIVSQWRTLAKALQLNRREQEYMAAAFDSQAD